MKEKGNKMEKCLDVNMATCFWCKEDYGVTIGKEFVNCDRTSLTPKHMFVDYEPCEKCKKNWDEGDVIIEAQEEPAFEGQFEIAQGIYPTGNHWIIKKGLLDNHISFVTEEVAKEIGFYQEEKEDEPKE